MARRMMDMQTVVVGGGPVASLVVLVPVEEDGDAGPIRLPIRVGAVEATSISMGVDPQGTGRPMTHDLLRSVVEALGAVVEGVTINDVSGTTFFARLELRRSDGELVCLDSRPSDALALAVRTGAPIYAEDGVLEVAGLPDFQAIEEDERRQELASFHDFVESVSPEDFSV